MTWPSYARKRHKWFGDGPFRTVSSFSSPMILDRHIQGKPGDWMSLEERWIERCQRQRGGAPIRARRVPLESTYWDDRDDNPRNDHAFFNKSRASSLSTWNYDELRNGTRPGLNRQQPALTVWMQKYILHQVRLARKHDMKVEFVVDWTLKHSDGVGWNVIGHCIRQTAAFLRLIHIGKWDVGVDGNAIGHPTNPQANERIREMFDQAKGPIDHLVAFELHNEWNAHSAAAWRKDELTEKQALNEVNAQLRRTKRIKDGEPEQWPEGACWVSNGGTDHPETAIEGADARAVHPERPNMQVGSRFDHLKRDGVPVYANEILHYIDPSVWDDTIGKGVFRPRSSTKNTAERKRFVEEMLDAGLWVCEHSLTGMSNGWWWTGGDLSIERYEEMPLDAYEKAWGAAQSQPPAPQPPPTPDPPDPTPPDLPDLPDIPGLPGFVGDLLAQVNRIESNTQETLEIVRRIESRPTVPDPGPVEPQPPAPTDPPGNVPAPPVDPPRYMPLWDDIKNESYGRKPYEQDTYRRALFVTDQTLIWSVRNLQDVLGRGDAFAWPYHRGPGFHVIDKKRAQEMARIAEHLLTDLRHFVHLHPHKKEGVAIGGTWIMGRTRVANFERWYDDFWAYWPWMESAELIAG